MDYTRFLNPVARRYQGSLLRRMYKEERDAIYMSGGVPNPVAFPLQSASFNLIGGGSITLDPKLITDAQQYGHSNGYDPLVKQLKSLIHRIHSPPCWENTDLLVTPGGQNGLATFIEMMTCPGDYVIAQNPVYSGVISLFQPYLPKWLTVESDNDGMIPDSLRSALSRWKPEDMYHNDDGLPKLLYITPTGSNPTGTVVSETRRREIYAIACQYNLLILEDDPYYFLNFADDQVAPPSYLSLDTEGRVVRFDSMSKILGPGYRVGYVTGPNFLVDKLLNHQQTSTFHASVLAQVVLSEVLRTWGEEGFLAHGQRTMKFYRAQRDVILKAVEKHLKDLCEWEVPKGGMFLWVKVKGVSDTTEMTLKRALARQVSVMPGSAFMADRTKPCPYIRISFSSATHQELEEGIRRLALVIRDELKLQSTYEQGKQQ
ncbi:kynurenine/alpha-aminoadipate aminotransferase, mitochondrial isoform X2 [Procambarus clarkii]|uniref:kynurenine/alpha-aminoadipate aminotransferase, mitochondrial isoform X2 n=1 Tax=Procambarus clarkii TaxID=6728 RepID=UPI003742757B